MIAALLPLVGGVWKLSATVHRLVGRFEVVERRSIDNEKNLQKIKAGSNYGRRDSD